MSEERLDRLEGMMSQLITMVGNIHNTMIEMQKTINGMQTRMDGMEKSMDGMEKSMDGMLAVQKEHGQKFEAIELGMDKMETKNELRHQEVLQHLKRLEKDQDFIWEKAVRNERELEIMKRISES